MAIPPETWSTTVIKVDDRTAEQRPTHRWGVVAKDKFMSGWGQASNGASRCAWACAPEADLTELEKWVRNRSEMRYVNVVDLNTYRAPRGTAHFHIYVCDQEHPNQNRLNGSYGREKRLAAGETA